MRQHQSVFFIVAFASLLCLTVAQVDVYASVRDCPDDPGQQGYRTIIDINTDQQNELVRLQNGGASQAPYVFSLCKHTLFQVPVATLQVLLDDISFVCGTQGLSSDLCELNGGLLQVNIPAGSTTNVAFSGITFRGVEQVAIGAYASSSSTLTLVDTRFVTFVDDAVLISQKNDDIDAMTVTMTNTVVQNGVGGMLFDNEGGSLTVDTIDVMNVGAEALFHTTRFGSLSLENVVVEKSDITRITSTMSASSATVSNVLVTEMTAMGSIFYAEGAGTSTSVDGAVVRNNYLLDAFTNSGARNFNGLVVKASATGSAENVTYDDNNGVDCIVRASTGSQVTATDYLIERSNGTSPPDSLSSLFLAEAGSLLNVLRAEMRLNYGYSTAYMAVCGSFLQVVQSCLHTGKFEAASFVGQDSNFVSTSNYISTVLETQICREKTSEFLRFQEDTANTCFLSVGSCTGECVSGFNDGDCQVDASPMSLETIEVPEATDGSCPSVAPTSPPSPPTVTSGGDDGGDGVGGGVGGGDGGAAGGDDVVGVDAIGGDDSAAADGGGAGGSGGSGDDSDGGTADETSGICEESFNWAHIAPMVIISIGVLLVAH